MTAQPSKMQFALEIVRSRFIEAHAGVEAAVLTRLRSLKIEPRCVFSQNLDALSEAKPEPQYPKTTKTRVLAALSDLRPYLEVRNDIVHGQMSIVELGGESYACFFNPQRYHPQCRRPTMATEDNLRKMARELERIASEIAAN